MIPKTTDWLAKFIRTGEGSTGFAFNLALLIVPLVSNALTPAQSAKWLTIIDGIAVDFADRAEDGGHGSGRTGGAGEGCGGGSRRADRGAGDGARDGAGCGPGARHTRHRR